MEEKNGMMMGHYMNERPVIFPSSSHANNNDHLHYAMVMLGGGSSSNGMLFGSDSTNNGLMGGSTNSGGGLVSGDSSGGGGCINNGGGGNGRWPKEETLILLEIRLRLDSKFKEATHKTPLWDEVSRIMCVEYGYKRTGKKCSEKFENLYKYYKKIKEGKAGRQDKKHYRFFRQLDAIYGETNTRIINPNPNPSYYVEETINEKKIVKKKHWKTMITDFIETKMNTLIEKQDAWMEKMMETIDQKEKERILKEEEWRNEEFLKLEKKKKFHLNEKARMVARDNALMEALHKLTNDHEGCSQNQVVMDWDENEITQLIEIRSGMEMRFVEQNGCLEELLWEEVALKMSCFGYNRNGLSCKGKWDQINLLLRTKKRKENIRCSNMYMDDYRGNYAYNQEGERSVGQINDSKKVLMSDDPEEIMWNCYGMKMTKGDKQLAWPY